MKRFATIGIVCVFIASAMDGFLYFASSSSTLDLAISTILIAIAASFPSLCAALIAPRLKSHIQLYSPFWSSAYILIAVSLIFWLTSVIGHLSGETDSGGASHMRFALIPIITGLFALTLFIFSLILNYAAKAIKSH